MKKRRNTSKLRILMFGLIWGGLTIAGIPALFPDLVSHLMVFVWAGGAVMFGGIVFGIVFYDALTVGGSLNLRGLLSPKYCPHCGRELD